MVIFLFDDLFSRFLYMVYANFMPLVEKIAEKWTDGPIEGHTVAERTDNRELQPVPYRKMRIGKDFHLVYFGNSHPACILFSRAFNQIFRS